MKLLGKSVAVLLLLLLLGVPAVACMVPDAQLTEAEKACCRAMANDCGSMDMGSERSCCQKVVQHHDSALVKEISTAVHTGLSLQVAVIPAAIDLTPVGASSPVPDAAWHAPPGTTASSIEILRI